jgi:hypothetical protein
VTTELHPSRQEISIFRAIPEAQSNRLCCLLPAVCAVICFGAIVLGSVTRSFAQGTPPQTQNQTQPSASKAPKSQSGILGSDTYNLLQKKSLFFPNIATSTERLSPGGKFKLFVDNSISVSTILWAAASSGVSQAADSPTGYEQGWDAYGKRFGSYMARNASSEFFGTFVLASALHKDPRFFPKGNPSFGGAIKHSVKSLFVTRNDDGSYGANVSGLAGPLMAEGLANVYWPDQNRTVGDTFFRYGLDLATIAGLNLFREYWPVLSEKMHLSPRPTQGLRAKVSR